MANDKKKGKNVLTIVLVLIIVVVTMALALVLLDYQKVKKEVSILTNPELQQEMAQQEIDMLIKKVSKLIMLPEGQPVLATVQEAEKLAEEQEFFKNSQDGDKVLVYETKAYIYRESENKLINVGPVFIDNAEQEVVDGDQANEKPADVIQEDPKLNIEVRNGTTTAGLASTVANKLRTEKLYNIKNVGDAANKDYSANIIVNLAGKDVSALEKQLKTKAVTSLPEGEASTSAEVLVILGSK